MYLHTNIKFLRNYVRLTQSEFGKIFEWSRANVDSYERAIGSPQKDKLVALAKHFSIPLETLLSVDLQMNPGLLYASASAKDQRSLANEDALKAKDETIKELKSHIKSLEGQVAFLKAQNERLIKKLKVA